MGNEFKGGGYGYVSTKDNYEDILHKKSVMQRRFVEMCSSNPSVDHKPKIENTTVKSSRKTRNKDTEEHRELELLKKELKKYKKELSNTKKDLDNTKKNRFEYIKKLEEKELELSSLRTVNTKLVNDIETEKEKVRLKEVELCKALNSVDLRELKTLRVENQKLTNKVKSLTSDVKVAKKKVQNYQMLRGEELEEKIIKKYKVKLSERENEIDNLKHKLGLSKAAINRLNHKIINRKKQEILKKKDSFNNQVNAESLVEDNDRVNVDFGYLSLNGENELIFVNLQSKRYKLSEQNNIDGLNKFLGMPVRVEITDDIATVDYIYYNLSKGAKAKAITNKAFKVRKSAKNKLIVNNQFQGKKILIIGSKNKGKYISLLANSGAEVKWHESFSDNESRIDDLASSSDVVIVCTSHISHSVLYKINTLNDYKCNSNKYQLIEKDNSNNIVHRIRYALENSKRG